MATSKSSVLIVCVMAGVFLATTSVAVIGANLLSNASRQSGGCGASPDGIPPGDNCYGVGNDACDPTCRQTFGGGSYRLIVSGWRKCYDPYGSPPCPSINCRQWVYTDNQICSPPFQESGQASFHCNKSTL